MRSLLMMALSDARQPPRQAVTTIKIPTWVISCIATIVSVSAFFAASVQWYVPLLASISIVLLIALFRAVRYTSFRPEWLLCILAALGILTDASFLNETQRASLHYGLLFLFCIPVLPKVARLNILGQGGFRLYLYYFAWAAFTITYTAAPEPAAARIIAGLLGFAVLASCLATLHSADDVPRLLLRYLAGCIIALTVALVGSVLIGASAWQSPFQGFTEQYVEQLNAHGITAAGILRFRAIFSNPNIVGVLALLTTSTALVVWRTANKSQRAALAVAIILSLGADILADSRTPLVALVIGIGSYLLWKHGLRGAAFMPLALAVGIVIALFFGLNFRDYTMRGESDLTGRTELWRFVVQQIYARPLLGYGYGSGGSILLSRFSPLWDAMWNEGPHTSLHNGYIEHMVDVGIPATAFWLFVTLRPWVHLFRHEGDPNHLKSVFFLIVLPLLIQNCAEAAIGDCEGSVGVLFGVCWFMAERYRLASLARTRTAHERELANAPAGIRALLFNQC